MMRYYCWPTGCGVDGVGDRAGDARAGWRGPMIYTDDFCRRGPSSICRGCNAEVDCSVCWCGSDPGDLDHRSMDGHPFVPSGCTCLMHGGPKFCDPRDRGACEVWNG